MGQCDNGAVMTSVKQCVVILVMYYNMYKLRHELSLTIVDNMEFEVDKDSY